MIINFSSYFRGKFIHNIILNKRIIHYIPSVRSSIMLITVIHFKIANFNSKIFHKIIKEITFNERKFIKLNISAFYPHFEVMYS